MSLTKTSDTEAMEHIQLILDGNEWKVSDLGKIAAIVNDTGRGIAEPGEHTREDLIELIREDFLEAFAKDDRGLLEFMDNGFKGFDNMSYSELLLDAANNGLIETD
jgi:hypothetical protein